ncbi:MAG: hypothetical protein RL417_464 [Pseudomonadota bacterium]
MQRSSHIVLLKLGDILPPDVAEQLAARGYRVTSVAQLTEALPDWERIQNPTLLVDGGSGRQTIERIIKTLVEHRRFLNCPIIFASSESRAVHATLAPYFSIAVTLGAPCGGSDVLHRLETVRRGLIRLGPQGRLVSPKEEAAADKALVLGGSLDNSAAELGVHRSSVGLRYADAFGSAVNVQFERARLAGAVVTTPYTLGELCTAGLCPLDESSCERVRPFLDRLDRGGRRQILRTAALVGSVGAALHLSNEERERGALCALLYGCGFALVAPDTLRGDYRTQRRRDLRERFVRGLEESARLLEQEWDRADLGGVVRCFGDIVAKRPGVAVDSGAMRLATLLYGADLVGRICFLGGWWNPRSAHSILGRLKDHTIRALPAAVADALLKIVAAGVADHPRGFVVPRLLREDHRLRARAREWREMPLEAGEERVALIDLVPGMRLARGLETFDGALILESDATLDEDLIWRLWRLSAVRPVNGPVIVLSPSASPGAEPQMNEDGLAAEIDAILRLCRPTEIFDSTSGPDA